MRPPGEGPVLVDNTESIVSDQPLSIMPFLKVPEAGDPYLEGFKCTECDAISLKSRMACAKCGGRDTLKPHKLSCCGFIVSQAGVQLLNSRGRCQFCQAALPREPWCFEAPAAQVRRCLSSSAE